MPVVIPALLAIFVLALLFRQAALTLFTVMLLVSMGAARLWQRWSLRRVTYRRELSQTRAFPGDDVTLTITLTNRKLLPLAQIQIFDTIPSGVQVLDGPVMFSGSRQSNLLRRSTGLRWYERVIWRYRLRCERRGTFRFGPAQAQSGDPFGIYRSETTFAADATLLVYPRLRSLAELGLPARDPLGLVRASALLRDPLRVVGVREYAPSDPLKDVHWAATARTGTLQTRVYEPTTAHVVALVLDLDTFEFYFQGIDPDLVEHMIGVTATLAHSSITDGHAVGLYANGAPVEAEHLVRLSPGRSPNQLAQIMETLARLTAYSVVPGTRLLRLITPELHPGATIVLIGAVASDSIRAALLRLHELGFRVVWVFCGATAAPAVPGVNTYWVPMRQ
ncbi:DUF58 domain-containing protein [Chloroflexus aggregans]|uniref:Conserved repeat domain protein n=1 Tax=Chloroflexus aggregans (strain MD-66 / DSM 9485) TaxID=326427 RepID=B8G4S6_CHLAD|nr:DUF58 domain-containing protein [Chloroflexus aggregans]ACL25552.1 conserved repeat domain protein [Chloroflexus aggregans DSM 9485]